MKCQRCGFDNPSQMRYCGDCGAPLVITHVEEEKKEVAVLFADICDFTAMVAAHDPEEMKTKIDACLRLMADSVTAYDGVVGKFIGDAVMAVFGVPISHENDAERAVRAGITIRDKIFAFGENSNIKIELRIGIHTGEAIVAIPEGTPGREVNIFGDTVNIASRLEDTGTPGQIIVSREIYDKTNRFFNYEEIDTIQAKGIEIPLERYRFVAERVSRGKVRGFSELSAPMIGREKELGSLITIFNTVKKEQKSQITAVIGEAGIGKTRLIEEFLQKLRSNLEDISVVHGRCLGYAGASSFLPFVQIVKQVASIKDVMSVGEMRKLVTVTVRGLMRDVNWGEIDANSILLEMLSLSSVDRFTSGHNTSQIFDQVLLVMEKLFQALAVKRPLIMFIEDIHWADGATLELIKHLARALVNTPTMLLFNSRPPLEYNSAVANLLEYLSSFKNFQQIKLVDLTPKQSRQLVSSLLTIEKLSEESKGFIVERSGGNPFFVEEMIKTLIELGIVEHRGDGWEASRQLSIIDVPDSIEGVLRSRLDHLPRLEKKVIQRAAVVGRVFWRKMVRELMEENVIDFLLDLEQRDMINQRLDSMFEDDVEYIFKHSLLHESVYQSLLKRVRQELHLKTAQWIEENYQEKINTCLDLIAFHFEMGGEKEKAAGYYLKAAKHAASLYDNNNAKEYFLKATKLSKNPQILLPAYTGWGEICALTDRNEEALDRFESARLYSKTKLEEASILQQMGDVYEKMSSYSLANEFLQQATELLSEMKPDLLQAKILRSLARLHYLWGDYKESFRLGKEGEIVLGEIDRSDAEAETVKAMIYYEIANAMGDLEKREERFYYRTQTVNIYKKLGNLFGMGRSLNGVGIDEWDKGNYSLALENLLQSFQICGSCGNRLGQAITCNNLGEIYISLGNYEKARYYFEHYLSLNAIIGNRLGDGYAHGGLGRIALENGDYDLAQKELEIAKSVFNEVAAREKEIWIDFDLAYLRVLRREEEKNLEIETRFAGDESHKESLDDLRLQTLVIRCRYAAQPEPASIQYQELAQRVAETILKQNPTVETLEGSLKLAECYLFLGDTVKQKMWEEKSQVLMQKIGQSITDGELLQSFNQRIRRLFPILY